MSIPMPPENKGENILGAFMEKITAIKENMKAINEERYHDLPDTETESERAERIMETPAAWR